MLVCSALQHAAAVGFADCIPLLLECGADIDGQDRHGVTALSMAARKGQAWTVKLLLDGEADFTLHDDRYDTDCCATVMPDKAQTLSDQTRSARPFALCHIRQTS